MSCFCDKPIDPSADKKYITLVKSVLPTIKKDIICKRCLKNNKDAVTMANCPLWEATLLNPNKYLKKIPDINHGEKVNRSVICSQ